MRKAYIYISLIFAFGIFGYLYFGKTSSVNLENQFGTFSITCRGFEAASGKFFNGFGICFCDKDISSMKANLNTVNINKYKAYLKEKNHSKLLENILTIEKSLALNDLALYKKTLDEYALNFNQLDESTQNSINSFITN